VAAGVLTNIDLNGHYGVFTIISDKACKTERSKECNEIRDMSHFKLDEYLQCQIINLFENKCILSASELYNQFTAKFIDLVNRFAPMRKEHEKK